jgi:hypothetical protein
MSTFVDKATERIAKEIEDHKVSRIIYLIQQKGRNDESNARIDAEIKRIEDAKSHDDIEGIYAPIADRPMGSCGVSPRGY